MNLIGRTEVTTIDEPDHLQFVIASSVGWLDLMGLPTPLIALTVWAWLSQRYPLSIVCGAALISVSASIMKKYPEGSVIKLFVSQSELIARGDVRRAFSEEIKVKTANIKSLGYQMGGKNSPSGLYADQGWLTQTCLVSGLRKQQANSIADKICQRFPNIKR